MKNILLAAAAALSVTALAVEPAFAQRDFRRGEHQARDDDGGRDARRGQNNDEGQRGRRRDAEVQQPPQGQPFRPLPQQGAAVPQQQRQDRRDFNRDSAGDLAGAPAPRREWNGPPATVRSGNEGGRWAGREREPGDAAPAGADRSRGERQFGAQDRRFARDGQRGEVGSGGEWRARGQDGARDGGQWRNNDSNQRRGDGRRQDWGNNDRRGDGASRNDDRNQRGGDDGLRRGDGSNRQDWGGNDRRGDGARRNDGRNQRRGDDGQWRGDGRRQDWGSNDRRGSGDWDRDRRGGRDWSRDGRRDWADNDHWRNEWRHSRSDSRYRPYWNTHRDFARPRYHDWRSIRYGYYFDYGYAHILSGYYGRNYYWWSYDGWHRPYRRWRVGYVIPTWLYWEPLPWDLYYRLPPAPYGCRYVYADGDILLIAIASGIIIDALLYDY